MNKQEQIEAKKIKPIEVGDYVLIYIKYQKESTNYVGKGKKRELVTEKLDKVFKTNGNVVLIDGDNIHIKLYSVSVPFEIKDKATNYYDDENSNICVTNRQYVFPTFVDCGVNPFGKEKRRIQFYNQDLGSLLHKAGYGRRSNDFEEPLDGEFDFNRVNFDPYVYDENGEIRHYQRSLVWTLEQKQLLIDSIYNGIEIGKFLFRFNSWARLKKLEKETGSPYSYDCVDGKQRFFAILEFLQNKYPDSYGNYWKDLSTNAHQRFMGYGNLSYGELPETATDQDVIDNFLTLNFTGVPMSKEHIEYVKTFKL